MSFESGKNTPTINQRLLLVDDDIVDRENARRLLNSVNRNFVIDEAKSYAQALELCNRENYDCILLDYHLGEGTALELLPQLKQTSSDARLAIVLITGKGNEYLVAEAFKAGVHDYISKANLQAEMLVAAIDHAVWTVNIERENEQQKNQLEFVGLHDSLTGLPNRKLFFDRLEQAIRNAERSGTAFSICYMDLDDFQRINDQHGHEAGDEVLGIVSKRIVDCLRNSDIVARIGSDEFVAVLDIPEPEAVVMVADKLIAEVAKPIYFDDTKLNVGISIGICNFPACGRNAKKLLSKADTAMQEAKRGVRGVVIFSDDKQKETSRAAAIATEMSVIIEDNALEIEYQPKVNLFTNKVAGAEALVRWRHPTLGLLPPVEFIPAMERTQKIKPMTYFVAELAIKQCASWREQGIDIPIAVNLSAKILDSKELPQKIAQLLDKWSLPAEFLILELTETWTLSSQQLAADLLFELSSLGVKISIDDFGTGYTSFSYLREFTIDEIKIDRIFVDDLIKGKHDESIIRSMLELGKGLGVGVTAEGIENKATLEKLKSLGCGFGQGFFFSGSLPADNFLSWAKDWNSQS